MNKNKNSGSSSNIYARIYNTYNYSKVQRNKTKNKAFN